MIYSLVHGCFQSHNSLRLPIHRDYEINGLNEFVSVHMTIVDRDVNHCSAKGYIFSYTAFIYIYIYNSFRNIRRAQTSQCTL